MDNVKPGSMITAPESREWFYCHGSQLMKDHQGEVEDYSINQDIAAHWVAKQIISPYLKMNGELTFSNDFIGKLSPNNVTIDAEMHQCALDYVTDILQYCNVSGKLRFVKIEETLSLESIYPGMSGTPDAWIYNAEELELIVWGFEYSHGHIQVYENPELMTYVAGLLDLLQFDNGEYDQHLTVKIRIVQPRSFHNGGPVHEWTVKASDLRGSFNKLKHAAFIAMSGEANCNSGNHCRKCKARVNCPSITKTVYNSIDVIESPIPMTMTGNNLALELQLLNRMTKLLKYRQESVKKQVEYEINNGAMLPGFIRVDTYGNLAWKKKTPIEEVLMMADLMGVDIRKPNNLDTPTQAKVKFKDKAKQLGITLDDTAIMQYTENPWSGTKVIEDDGSKIREAFTKEI